MKMVMRYPESSRTLEEYSGLAHFISQAIECTPLLQTVFLEVPTTLSVHASLLRTIHCHPHLTQVSIPSVSFDHHLYLPKSPPPNLPAGDRVTVVVIHGRCDRRELEYVRKELVAWQSLYDWGISVDHLEIDDSRYLSETEWSTTTFRGLRSLIEFGTTSTTFLVYFKSAVAFRFGQLKKGLYRICPGTHLTSGMLLSSSRIIPIARGALCPLV